MDTISTRLHRRTTGLALLAVLAGGAGCTIHMEERDLVLGPVLYRFETPRSSGSFVLETTQLPVWGDVWRQWAIGAGWKTRAIALPSPEFLPARDLSVREPIPLFGAPDPGEWNLSLLALEVPSLCDVGFFATTVRGARFALGEDANAATFGYSRQTAVLAAPSAHHRVEFDSGEPLKTVFQVSSELGARPGKEE